MNVFSALQTGATTASPLNVSPPGNGQGSTNARALDGPFNFSPRAAGIGKQQFDKIVFDKVGPSSQGWGRTSQQVDGSWRTEIDVPFGDQLGGHHADRRTTLSFVSKQPPTLDNAGHLFISGREISGDFLEGQLAKLNLPVPDWSKFTFGSDPD